MSVLSLLNRRFMRPKSTLLLAIFFSSTLLQAQNNSNIAFAITSNQKGATLWNEVRKINLTTGAIEQTVYDQPAVYKVYDARTGKQLVNKQDVSVPVDLSLQPFSTYVAACAYDKLHNRLYYTPLFVNQLRYIDLSARTPSMYFYTGDKFSPSNNLNNETDHLTRMAIGSDGNGYAISNDGNSFIQFTTGKNEVIVQLGSLIDDASNGDISIHDRLSWGGDIIASTSGNLYLFAASHRVFKINIAEKKAVLLGSLEGLPKDYTTNGAVVDAKGFVIVSSALSVAGYYKVDMKTLKAEKISGDEQVFNASDLANGNLLIDHEAVPELLTRTTLTNSAITTFPNPVTDNIVNISFGEQLKGRYTVDVVNIEGKLVAQKLVTVIGMGQVEKLSMDSKMPKAVYFVKITNANNKLIYSDKILVQ